jgi:hypothetical protein
MDTVARLLFAQATVANHAVVEWKMLLVVLNRWILRTAASRTNRMQSYRDAEGLFAVVCCCGSADESERNRGDDMRIMNQDVV